MLTCYLTGMMEDGRLVFAAWRIGSLRLSTGLKSIRPFRWMVISSLRITLVLSAASSLTILLQTFILASSPFLLLRTRINGFGGYLLALPVALQRLVLRFLLYEVLV
ncbi:orf106a (mitochondrion) [Beta vulgaris subsp. vulgaris]|uniref:Orf106a protein n=3 Tax=Beta TaxID=3554 RepID=Q9MFF2_BETVV|nr:orf106a [Beta vulgaris subsp. vulgaris]YP_004222307.1 hypothetical protein LKY74_mgp093 [Beta vulgaris subsp. maritima]YP_004842112.1 hypothetical protein LKY79_mgp094 [Beta macrocarpa]CBJ17534.1 hypothetical protein [Beta vulgaris subsp. maritima]CBX24916.1 hypothetical protein [Beta macrocarpa]BAA99290.1 orf106a [Beta vulgaris subsp. vulgaris]